MPAWRDALAQVSGRRTVRGGSNRYPSMAPSLEPRMLDDEPGGPLAEVPSPGDDSQATLSPWIVLGGILLLILLAIAVSMMAG